LRSIRSRIIDRTPGTVDRSIGPARPRRALPPLRCGRTTATVRDSWGAGVPTMIGVVATPLLLHGFTQRNRFLKATTSTCDAKWAGSPAGSWPTVPRPTAPSPWPSGWAAPRCRPTAWDQLALAAHSLHSPRAACQRATRGRSASAGPRPPTSAAAGRPPPALTRCCGAQPRRAPAPGPLVNPVHSLRGGQCRSDGPTSRRPPTGLCGMGRSRRPAAPLLPRLARIAGRGTPWRRGGQGERRPVDCPRPAGHGAVGPSAAPHARGLA
jgi:hypothetical protein